MRTTALATVLVLALVAGSAMASSWLKNYRRTERYDGHKVFSCHFNSQKTFENLLSFTDDEGFDVWDTTADSVVFRATPEQQLRFSRFLSKCSVVVPDVEEHVRAYELRETQRAKSLKNADWFEEYHTYEEIYKWYSDFAAANPALVTFIPSIGKSIEGRNQPIVRITSGRGSNKPNFYMQCQIHAREWISGATCNWMANELVAQYGTNSTVGKLLDSAVIHFLPFTNPDGYSFTWTNDRLWRKNRNTNSGNTCRGVDLNRNYNSHWGEGGSSASPCSDTYKGTAPNSEIEVRNTIAYFKSIAPVYGAIDWHSYSQLILRPYGWTRTNAPDETLLKSIGDGMRDVIRSVNGVTYTSQKSIDLYVTTGTASDWFYDNEATAANGGYRAAGYTIELRDTGRQGFELDPIYIIPSGQENFAALVYFVQRLLASPIRA